MMELTNKQAAEILGDNRIGPVRRTGGHVQDREHSFAWPGSGYTEAELTAAYVLALAALETIDETEADRAVRVSELVCHMTVKRERFEDQCSGTHVWVHYCDSCNAEFEIHKGQARFCPSCGARIVRCINA